MKSFFISLIFILSVFLAGAQSDQKYTNPILGGFYPDPSICRVGEDYYLVNSTFSYFPGIPVFHSKDLVNWKLLGHVITRAEQMDFTGKGVSRSIFAPTIRYHEGVFYVTCTMIDGGGNFVVTATNPAGPWSNPYWLSEIDGIDPSLFFDEDGSAYITYNSIPPDNKSLYDGHRTIRMNRFDYKTMKVIGENKILVNGGTDLSKKPSWIEGPHIVKKYGYYYLISAEGGTGPDHSVVAFRSASMEGPFLPYENNPILTQRHLTGERKYPITSTGHADFVELPNGKWYSVFLGTRPYQEDYFNTGRETFLTPVEWKNEWPVINPGYEEVRYSYPFPLPENKDNATTRYSGNFSYKDNFDSAHLSPDWIFLRTVKEQWYDLNSIKGFLSIKLRPETVAGKLNPSYVARRQQHTNFTASTSLRFNSGEDYEKAGLLCFMNEDHFYFLCYSKENKKNVIQLYQSPKDASDSTGMILIASKVLSNKTITPIQLKAEAKGDKYAFYYSIDKKNWVLIKDNVDGKFLSTKVAGGFGSNFVGCTIGLYATSMGKQTDNNAFFDWFEYKGINEAYSELH